MARKKEIEQVASVNPIAKAHELGITNLHAYAAGFASIGLATCLGGLPRPQEDDKAQSDR